MSELPIELIDVADLRHIEGFSRKRVEWLKAKIVAEGVWNRPVALDSQHNLVLDGQHRMEVARALGLKRIPAVRYNYDEVEIWSLRPAKFSFVWQDVVERAVAGNPYPYKTVKHKFPSPLPGCAYPVESLLS